MKIQKIHSCTKDREESSGYNTGSNRGVPGDETAGEWHNKRRESNQQEKDMIKQQREQRYEDKKIGR